MTMSLQQLAGQLQRVNKDLERGKSKIGTASDTVGLRQRIEEQLNSGSQYADQIRDAINGHTDTMYDDYDDTEVSERDLTLANTELQRYNDLSDQINRLLSSSDVSGFSSDDGQPGPYTSDEKLVSTQVATAVQLEEDGFHAVNAIASDIEEQEKRLEQVEHIAQGIGELNEAFTDINAIVNEQQEQLDEIETNVDQTKANVESGTKHIEKAAEYQAAARRKMCYILMCLLVLGIIVVIIVGAVPGGFFGG